MNYNKKVSCTVCGRCMRSDNIARHMTTHQDLLSLSEEEVKEELHARHAVMMERELFSRKASHPFARGLRDRDF